MIYADWPVATAIGELIYCMRIIGVVSRVQSVANKQQTPDILD